MVASRDRATLEEVCKRRFKKGTEIVTDMWRGDGFADTKKKKHNDVKHSRNELVGSDGATTNHIEARWKHVRASLPKNGLPRWFHEGYIQAEQLRKMPWTFQDFLRECGSVTKVQLDLMLSFEDEEKQTTITLLTVDSDRRKLNAELIQKSEKAIRSHQNRKLHVIQKQQSLASIQLDEERGPDSPRFVTPITIQISYVHLSKRRDTKRDWVEDVDGDGNCGLSAIRKTLTQQELEAHPDLRGELADEEKTNPHFFEEFGDNFEVGTYHADVGVIGIDGSWISELDLAAFSHILERPIECMG
ncbi:hypothetical protein BLNAU_18774 [Blattamonas nauphoetae]|uniref:OTU domain-containing protein n=1 Tax=Blattamonas nauphoetae TaxID=2049346 RepID=A0ABQ9X3I0_9EUKA|nr:hypothetical protein BLNAU_18774 [Blattamonas nauphoetae]